MAMAYAGGSYFANGKVCVCDELDWTIGADRDILAAQSCNSSACRPWLPLFVG